MFISLRGRAGTAKRNVPTSELHMQNLLLNFLKLNFLLFDVALVAISVVVAICVNCWDPNAFLVE